jgi:hypothetical protein
MKKTLFILALVSGVTISSIAQNTVGDLFSKKEVVWYGFDFTNIKMIGSSGFNNPQDIVKTFFSAWNNIVFDELEKFNIMKLLKMKSVKYSLSMLKEMNSKVDPAQLVINTDYSINKDQIDEIVSKYNTPDQKGIGMVFIMESFNNNEKKGYMWVTFFDISTKTVLLTERMSGEAGGTSFRNYWIKTVTNVLLEINKTQLKVWESQYSK